MSTLTLRIGIGLVVFCGTARAQDAQVQGVTVTIASGRQAVSAPEVFPLKLTIANVSHEPAVRFERQDVVGPDTVVAATFERKGKWAEAHGPAADGAIELRPGESFTIETRVSLPQELTKTPTSLMLQWVGRGALKGVRSNEINVTVRDDRNPTATLETAEGTIVLELWPDKAPNHVANFLTLAKSGFYDGRLFHRVMPGFMVQTGCPHGNGTGDAGYKIAAEFNDTSFVKGTLGMARSTDPDSAGSQFFVCVADSKSLDRQYTAFGKVLEGQEVADKISQAPRDVQRNDRPYKDIVLKKATVVIPASYQLPEVKKVGAPETRPETREGGR